MATTTLTTIMTGGGGSLAPSPALDICLTMRLVHAGMGSDVSGMTLGLFSVGLAPRGWTTPTSKLVEVRKVAGAACGLSGLL